MGIRILLYHAGNVAQARKQVHVAFMYSVCKSMPKFTIMLILK